MLSQAEISEFNESGHLIIENFKSPKELENLREAALELVGNFSESDHAESFRESVGWNATDYFLSSGDKIAYFFESDAFDSDGKLVAGPELCLNKLGHAMHDLHPVFNEFSRDQRLEDILRDIGLNNPKIWQSMYIFKQPRIGDEIKWHQDATYFSTQPQSVKAFWFALDDATLENGCLWVAPGRSELRQHFIVEDGRPSLKTINETPWPELSDSRPLEVSAGTLVLFDGLLPHCSASNTSDLPRHAYTLHVVDGNAQYSQQNWLQREDTFPVRGFH